MFPLKRQIVRIHDNDKWKTTIFQATQRFPHQRAQSLRATNCSSWAPNLSNWRLNLYLFKRNFSRKSNRRQKESKRNEKTNTVVTRCCSEESVRGPHPVTCSSLPSRKSEIIFPYLCEGRKSPRPPRKLAATPVGTTWTLFRAFQWFNPIWFLHPSTACKLEQRAIGECQGTQKAISS